MTDNGIIILVDADACPVKDEVYRFAGRDRVIVMVVANAPIMVPRVEWVVRVHVDEGPDVADDWIAARARRGAIVVTADVPLAYRCIKSGADVIAPNGKAFSEASIGAVRATRDLLDSLRSAGEITGGPPPFSRRDRSMFLQALDLAIQRLKRAGLTPSKASDP